MTPSPENTRSEVSVAEEIEGGEINLDSRVEWKGDRHRAETASRIAFVLIAIFGTSLLIHYAALISLHVAALPDAAKSLEQVYEMWLPVLSGFVGGAVTFYFTRMKD